MMRKLYYIKAVNDETSDFENVLLTLFNARESSRLKLSSLSPIGDVAGTRPLPYLESREFYDQYIIHYR